MFASHFPPASPSHHRNGISFSIQLRFFSSFHCVLILRADARKASRYIISVCNGTKMQFLSGFLLVSASTPLYPHPPPPLRRLFWQINSSPQHKIASLKDTPHSRMHARISGAAKPITLAHAGKISLYNDFSSTPSSFLVWCLAPHLARYFKANLFLVWRGKSNQSNRESM